jgi:hypothetical protein
MINKIKYLFIIILLGFSNGLCAQNYAGGDGDGFAVSTVSSQAIPSCEDLVGEVNPGATMCYGASTGTLTVINFSGTVVKWQRRVESGAWSDVSNVNATYSEIPASTGTWDYRTIIETAECGEVASDFVTIIVNPLPGAPGDISGKSEVCEGESSISYSVSAISEATSYDWAYSGTGAIINGTGNDVTIDFLNTATSGNLRVKGVNDCGDGTISANYAITVNPLPDAAGTITGTSNVCKGESAVSYSVTAIGETTSYDWAYSGSGATINGIGNDVTIDFSSAATSGELTVIGTNDCGDGTVSSNYSITVNAIPEKPGTITGASTVCEGESAVSYTVTEISDATSFLWSYSGEGATINGTGNSVTLDFSASATSGDLTVKATNDCDDGAVSNQYSITVIPSVGSAGTITGDADVCQGAEDVSYAVEAIANAESYLWTLPEGANGTSITNSILLNFNDHAESGDLSVKGLNTCSEGAESKISLTIIDAVYPKIRAKWGDVLICYNIGDSIQTYQWYKDGVEIQGESEQFCQTHKEPGSYFVMTTDEYGCSNASNMIEIAFASAYKIYPNPTTNNAEVKVIDEQVGDLTISIINSAGLLVKSFNEIKSDVEYKGKLGLSDLLPGIYTIEFKINGQYMKYDKLVILE